MTVRELIQNLIFNCELNDHVEVEVMIPCGMNSDGDYCHTYKHCDPRHVFRMGEENAAIIECHDN